MSQISKTISLIVTVFSLTVCSSGIATAEKNDSLTVPRVMPLEEAEWNEYQARLLTPLKKHFKDGRVPNIFTTLARNPELFDSWMKFSNHILLASSLPKREKELIITGGYNVYPNEVDDVLFEHPGIIEACTIGVPDEYRGETIRAYVVKSPGESLTADEVISFCREKLAAYKVPKEIVFTDELPKSTVGKILRRELRAEAEAGKK